MENNSTIHIGSIVTISAVYISDKMTHVGKVLKMNIWDGIGGVLIMLPGNGTIEVSLERCYNATEEDRKKYFLNILKYEN